MNYVLCYFIVVLFRWKHYIRLFFLKVEISLNTSIYLLLIKKLFICILYVNISIMIPTLHQLCVQVKVMKV